MNDKQAVCKQRIDSKLSEYLADYETPSTRLKSAMHYSLFNGGKRMRPWLSDTIGAMLGADQQDTDIVGMAIECIHAYSLIHDDLPAMDNDDLRRGKPTNHIQYDEATAILAGDALQALAFELLSSANMSLFGARKRIELVKVLARSSGLGGMCAGQSLDLLATNQHIELQQLQQLHQLKTGALLQASVEMAAHLSPDVSLEEMQTLNQYAQLIGLAFQVQDDILDVISDSQTLGKPQGSDHELNKSTFVSHLGIEGAQQFLSSLQQESLQAIATLPYNTRPLKEFTDYLVTRNY